MVHPPGELVAGIGQMPRPRFALLDHAPVGFERFLAGNAIALLRFDLFALRPLAFGHCVAELGQRPCNLPHLEASCIGGEPHVESPAAHSLRRAHQLLHRPLHLGQDDPDERADRSDRRDHEQCLQKDRPARVGVPRIDDARRQRIRLLRDPEKAADRRRRAIEPAVGIDRIGPARVAGVID